MIRRAWPLDSGGAALETHMLTPTRRHILCALAGLPLASLSLAWPAPANAKAARIERLIRDAAALPRVAQRMDFISRALLGARYQGHTLIGSPAKPEQFVVRDDAFDCVTYCEVVLAAAIVAHSDEFEPELRRVRYDHGQVQWDRRNHYFADWCQRNVENGICVAVEPERGVAVHKTVSADRALGPRSVLMTVVPAAALLQRTDALAPSDIVGFTSRRSNLDYFHTGLIAFAKDGALLLRHASQSRGRVIEESMPAFVAANRVRSVTLLRAAETAPVARKS
jgi:hypothetical protein